MKKDILILLLTTLCFSCSNGKVDENKINEAGDKLQKTVEKGADSVGSKLKKLKNKIDSTNADTIH